MSGVKPLANPRRIRAAHRRRRKVAWGPIVQRYYDPGIGRFLSVDPVSANPNTGAMFNRYVYANNNPYRFTDPDGRRPHDGGTLCSETSQCETGSFSNVREGGGGGDGDRDSASVSPISEAHLANPNNWFALNGAETGGSDKHDYELERELAAQFADAYAELVERGVISQKAGHLLAAAGARAFNAGNQAYNIGTLFAGIARNTLMSGPRDIDFYIRDGRPGPTGIGYQGSLINWGRADWRPFDPGLNNTANQIWINFTTAAYTTAQE